MQTIINVDNEVAADEMSVDCIIIDGAALTNMIKPSGATTFQDYANQKFTPHIKKQLLRSKRVDIVWDVYIENSLKFSARQKRGKSFAIILLACRLLHYTHQMETSE